MLCFYFTSKKKKENVCHVISRGNNMLFFTLICKQKAKKAPSEILQISSSFSFLKMNLDRNWKMTQLKKTVYYELLLT